MGAHDQTLDKDAHAGILDEDRRLTPVDIEPGAGQGANDEAYDTTLVLRLLDGKLVPDSLHVHTHGFAVTKWESKYSSIWSDPNWRDTPWRTQKLVPVVDASYCVVGHAGWIRAPLLCVPTETVSYDPHRVNHNIFWEFLEELRLNGSQAHSRAAGKGFSLAIDGHASATGLPPGPQIREPDGLRYRNNVNYFLSGGGKAVVGDGTQDRDIFESGDYATYVSDYEVVSSNAPAQHVTERITHRKDCYMFLVLVDPRGYLQAVVDDGIVPPPTFGEKALDLALHLIDLTLAILLVVDIVTIPVVLLRAGLVVGRAVAIRAVELVADKFTQTAERMAARDVQELLKLLRMGRLTVENLKTVLGGTVRAEGPLVSSSNMNIARETAGTGGIRAISGVRAADGSKKIVVQGYVRPSIGRRGFETRLVSGKDLGIPTYQRLHLWGPRLGDEAAAGIWLGPGAINIGEQARVEKLLQDLAIRAQREGGVVQLQITGTTHAAEVLPTRFRAHEFVSELTYEFRVVTPGTESLSGRVTIEIGPPPNGSIRMLGADNLP
jgi:hypothetical protein